MTHEDSQTLFSPREIADLLGEPEDRVLRWVRYGAIVGSHIDGAWRMRRDDLVAFARPLVARERLDSLEYPNGLQDPQIDGRDSIEVPAFPHVAGAGFERFARTAPLFHYTSSTAAVDWILRMGSLRLSSPVGANDPFESEPILPVVDRPPASPGEGRALEAKGREVSDLLRQRCRIACLTRSGPWAEGPSNFGEGFTRARMWDQYADGYAGVCLAFSQDHLRQAFRDRSGLEPRAEDVHLYEGPVRYRAPMEHSQLFHMESDQIYRRSDELKDYINDRFPSLVTERYFAKAWDWNTETEYRFLAYGGVQEFEYITITNALVGIFVGPRFPNERLEDLRRRCPTLWDAGRIYRLTWRESVPEAHRLTGHPGAAVNWTIPEPQTS